MATTTSGTFEAPPPGAPHETTQPVQDSAVQEALRMAATFEKPLPPFNPQPVGPPAPESGQIAATVSSAPPTDRGEPVQPDPLLALVPKRPAESDTDSPARGMPRQIVDPGKQITGGFGALGETQYYALDGTELRTLVLALMEDIGHRLENDLRFSIAITYPRVTARVRVEVEGYALDAGFNVERVKSDDRTPIDVAKERAEEIVFVVQELRREFNDAGEAENPPDRLRDELGISKPRKQFVQAGATRMIVDVPADLGTSF